MENNDVPIHTVYSRMCICTGTKKILMLVKPRTKDLTYTPTGIQVLKLNKEKLPSYGAITIMLARNTDKYVVVPYIKGRSEDEVTQLIKDNPILQYNVVDIKAEKLYTGEYGRLKPVNRYLRTITPLQSRHSIKLMYTPKDSSLYEPLLGLAEVHETLGGNKLMIGKNKEYIILYKACFDEILNDLKRCGRVYYLIAITKDFITARAEKAPFIAGHSMVISIDSQTLEIFDSNGTTPGTNYVYYWSNQLISYLKSNGLDLKRVLTIDEPFCPQVLTASAREFKGEQQCLIWSTWYIWLRINNPNISGGSIRNYMARMMPDESFDKMSKIASIVYEGN